MNYFELLELEQEYDLDLKTLNQQYFAMQARYHPDKAVASQDKQKYLAISMDLNKAYATLKDNLPRAEYLLQINGINTDNQALKAKMSQEQLNSIWDELEKVESTDDKTVLEAIGSHKNVEREKIITNLAVAFRNKNFQDALDITIRLKYLTNLINNIKLKIKNADSRD